MMRSFGAKPDDSICIYSSALSLAVALLGCKYLKGIQQVFLHGFHNSLCRMQHWALWHETIWFGMQKLETDTVVR